MRPVPRRPILAVPLLLLGCGSPDPTPEPVDVLARRSAALVDGDVDAAGRGYVDSARESLRRSDSRAVDAGLVEWAVEDLRGTDRLQGVLRVRVAGEGRASAGEFVADWDGALRPTGGTAWPWDLGEVTAHVVDGGVVLVVGVSSPISDQARDDLPGATARVDEVWGTDWPRGTGVVVVPTTDDVVRLGGDAGSDAVAVGLDAVLSDGRPAGVRVVLSTERFGALSAEGRRVTLTHELVHVATRATPAQGHVPRWLSEGYADHVARLDLDVPATALAEAILGTVPRVPADEDFTGTDRQPAYAAAWTLVTSAARNSGTPAVTALVRDVWAGGDVETACPVHLGRSFEDVVTTWRADVASGLVGWGP